MRLIIFLHFIIYGDVKICQINRITLTYYNCVKAYMLIDSGWATCNMRCSLYFLDMYGYMPHEATVGLYVLCSLNV